VGDHLQLLPTVILSLLRSNQSPCWNSVYQQKHSHTLFLQTECCYFMRNYSSAPGHMINCFNHVSFRWTAGVLRSLSLKYQKLSIN
jgi:hypothetical protein